MGGATWQHCAILTAALLVCAVAALHEAVTTHGDGDTTAVGDTPELTRRTDAIHCEGESERMSMTEEVGE